MAHAIRPWVCDTLNPTGPRAGGADQLGPSVLVGDELPLPGIAAQEARQLQPRQCPADDESLLVGLEMEPRFARHFFGTQRRL